MKTATAVEITGDTTNPSVILKKIKQSRLVVTTVSKSKS